MCRRFLIRTIIVLNTLIAPQVSTAAKRLPVSNSPVSTILLNWKTNGSLSAAEKRALDAASDEVIFDRIPIPKKPKKSESKQIQEIKKTCLETLTKPVYQVGRSHYKNRIAKKLSQKGQPLDLQLSKHPHRLDLSLLELTDNELLAATEDGQFNGVTQFILEHNVQLTAKGVSKFISLVGENLKVIDLSVLSLNDEVINSLLEHAPNIEVLDLGFGVSMKAIKKLRSLQKLRVLNIRHERYHFKDLLSLVQSPPPALQTLVYSIQESGLSTYMQNTRLAYLRAEARKHLRNTESGYLELSTQMKYDHIEFVHPKHIYDGDTGSFNIYEGLPPGLSEIFDIRTYAVDTGEKTAVSGKTKEEVAYEYLASIAARNIVLFTFLTNSEDITFVTPIKGKYFRSVASIYVGIDDGNGKVTPKSVADILIANNLGYYYFGETKEQINYKKLWNENKEEFSYWINMDWQPVIEDYKRRLGLKKQSTDKILKAAQEMEENNRKVAEKLKLDLPN